MSDPGAETAPAPAPIIVSALLAPDDFARLDALRRAHFPPERNQLRAHLTLFHHLPPSVARELCDALREETRDVAPPARVADLMSLGRGVAFRIDSPALAAIRARLADRFDPLLLPQDRSGWRAHVTVQNKVAPAAAKALLDALRVDFRPYPLGIAGLAAWWYRGGPWEPLCAWGFGGGARLRPPG